MSSLSPGDDIRPATADRDGGAPDEAPLSAGRRQTDAAPLSEDDGPPLGRHLLADFRGVEPSLLCDEALLMDRLNAALEAGGFTQLARHSHKFPGPGGVTGFVLLSESHAAFHTYPEHQYLAVDVFSCGMADPAPVIDALEAALRPESVRRWLQRRGGE